MDSTLLEWTYNSNVIEGNTQDYSPFTQFVAECVQASFEPYWFALGVQA